MSKIIDAVSVVFSYNEKIFTIKRQNYLKAFPGYLAFPGGKVDKVDHSTNDHLPDVFTRFPSHLVNAMIREVKEEMNLDVVSEFLNKSIDSIHYIGVAVTPDFNPVRFATHFYRINLAKQMPLEANSDEAKEFGWYSPQYLHETYLKGETLVVPPIMKLIEHLVHQPGLNGVIDFDFHFDSNSEVPMIESIKGLRQLPVLSNTLFPATRTNCFVIGDNDSNIVAMDPSPKDLSEYEKMLFVLKKLRITSIMLSHHHGDHNEFAPKLAKDLNLPLLMSHDTFSRLKNLHGEAWFLNQIIQFLKDGDVLTKWLGEDVLIHEIPGHDEGHLGLAPKSNKWFIVGDLFQGVGTVVIGGAEGSMKKYFSTLEKIISLAPKAVFPSHGIGLGGTHILEKTLEHRKMREIQILEMYQEGKSKEEMLATIYFDVDQRLHKYAMANIESHLEKLREENKL
jgi:glyoxylase-like metal-dependent hydrolase (beta-lactamase superfamily II)/8-oxo-dGTP pyrophosphatase MutT (NUDIX family)